MAFQQLQAIGQDHPEVFPLDVASEMVGIINLIWMKKMVWEMLEVISFQFARDLKAQVYKPNTVMYKITTFLEILLCSIL